jgi:hypothetical protein
MVFQMAKIVNGLELLQMRNVWKDDKVISRTAKQAGGYLKNVPRGHIKEYLKEYDPLAHF